MKKVLKNYRSTIILLSAIIIGVIVGLIFKEDAAILKPFGDLFLNLLVKSRFSPTLYFIFNVFFVL